LPGIAPAADRLRPPPQQANMSKGIRQAIETKSPQELEIASALWTRQAVRELIRKQVGIRLPIRTVGEYLRRWGYTPQEARTEGVQARSQGGGRMAGKRCIRRSRSER